MARKPWWWPKSHQDVDRLLVRMESFNTDFRLFMVMQAAIVSCEVIFAFGMSWCLIMVLVIAGRDIASANVYSLVGVGVFGLICSRLAYTFDHDVFREMSEVFLGIPLSRRTRAKLTEEFFLRF